MVLVPIAQYELSKKKYSNPKCAPLIFHHLLYENNPKAQEKKNQIVWFEFKFHNKFITISSQMGLLYESIPSL